MMTMITMMLVMMTMVVVVMMTMVMVGPAAFVFQGVQK